MQVLRWFENIVFGVGKYRGKWDFTVGSLSDLAAARDEVITVR